MGMPITVEIAEAGAQKDDIEEIFEYFKYVDEKFSTYKDWSEVSKINRGEISAPDFSADMAEIFRLAEETKKETGGYFDITKPDGSVDPSGLVKGWAVHNAAKILRDKGYKNFYVEAGGDIEAEGKNSEGKIWTVGIRNPFKYEEIVKVLEIIGRGVATSGSYLRGSHIYNPKNSSDKLEEIVSISVIGPDIYEADRFATAAFAMGRSGIEFIEHTPGLEGYMIDKAGAATMTSGFEKYVKV